MTEEQIHRAVSLSKKRDMMIDLLDKINDGRLSLELVTFTRGADWELSYNVEDMKEIRDIMDLTKESLRVQIDLEIEDINKELIEL